MSSTWQWLGRPVLALLILVALPQSARAEFIDLVSQSYLIQGADSAFPLNGGVVDFSYVETSTTPISRVDIVTAGGTFVLRTSADGGATDTSAFVGAKSFQADIGVAVAKTAEATAAITFRPLVTDLIVQTVNGSCGVAFPGAPPHCSIDWSSGISGLYDVSAGAAVLAFQGLITPAEYMVSLDLGHLYTIYASAPNAPGSGVELVPG